MSLRGLFLSCLQIGFFFEKWLQNFKKYVIIKSSKKGELKLCVILQKMADIFVQIF